MPILSDWSLRRKEGPYLAPELRTVLVGRVSGDPRFPDGTQITTSRLVRFDLEKMTATTLSGTIYNLGAPEEKWVQWCKDHGYKSWMQLVRQ